MSRPIEHQATHTIHRVAGRFILEQRALDTPMGQAEQLDVICWMAVRALRAGGREALDAYAQEIERIAYAQTGVPLTPDPVLSMRRVAFRLWNMLCAASGVRGGDTPEDVAIFTHRLLAEVLVDPTTTTPLARSLTRERVLVD